jgi:uroporphyrinogen-III decarboxylase
MAKITPKENYLRLARGELPEYISSWSMGMARPSAPAVAVNPSILGQSFGPPPNADGTFPTEWVDQWGITYVAVPEVGGAALPKPNHFILEDVTKWDKVVKKPELPNDFFSIDWEAMAKKDLESIDREQHGVLATLGNGPFQLLMGYMGFTEGLCALIEEPDAVKELLNYVADYYEPICEKIIEYYKPDIIYLLDDTASKYAPFFSVEIFQDIFKPIYVRYSKLAKERGIPIQFHNCGRAEDFVPDMIDFGVKYWDPAQQSNDLLEVKEKYKGQIAIVGAFDYVPPSDREPTEEEIRSYIRDVIDKFAPGGGFAFAGGIIGAAADAEKTMQYNTWVQDEVSVYGADYYNK